MTSSEGLMMMSLFEVLVTKHHQSQVKIEDVFEADDAIILGIEARGSCEGEFFVSCCALKSDFYDVIERLKDEGMEVEIVGEQENWSHWFPRQPHHMDKLMTSASSPSTENYKATITDDGSDRYEKRKSEVIAAARSFKYGDEIPIINYTPEERKVWREVYTKCRKYNMKNSCHQYQKAFQKMEREKLLSGDIVPQLRHLSAHLQKTSGFRLRPVIGLVSSREFLASLAFKIFQCTQYVRNAENIWHTTEPDICHEVIGHIPMLCDENFAEFSQQIGIASLGASDSDLHKIAMLYWFTIEMGVCLEKDEMKIYGAAILSSVYEHQHAMSGNAKFKEMKVDDELFQQPFVDHIFQPVYFVAKTFPDALMRVRKFSSSMRKKFEMEWDDEKGKFNIKPN